MILLYAILSDLFAQGQTFRPSDMSVPHATCWHTHRNLGWSRAICRVCMCRSCISH